MSFDWKKALPFIGALATGGVPALTLTAASAVAEALGRPVDATPAAIEAAVQSATPEQLAAMRETDARLKIAMRQADTEDRRIDADLDKAYLADVDSARKAHGTDTHVLWVGVAILVVWSGLTGMTVYGLYALLTGGVKIQDVGLVATIFTVLGSTVGYVSNIAQQVVGYYFGTSRGSAQKTDLLAKSMQQTR